MEGECDLEVEHGILYQRDIEEEVLKGFAGCGIEQ